MKTENTMHYYTMSIGIVAFFILLSVIASLALQKSTRTNIVGAEKRPLQTVQEKRINEENTKVESTVFIPSNTKTIQSVEIP